MANASGFTTPWTNWIPPVPQTKRTREGDDLFEQEDTEDGRTKFFAIDAAAADDVLTEDGFMQKDCEGLEKPSSKGDQEEMDMDIEVTDDEADDMKDFNNSGETSFSPQRKIKVALRRLPSSILNPRDDDNESNFFNNINFNNVCGRNGGDNGTGRSGCMLLEEEMWDNNDRVDVDVEQYYHYSSTC